MSQNCATLLNKVYVTCNDGRDLCLNFYLKAENLMQNNKIFKNVSYDIGQSTLDKITLLHFVP